MGKKRETKRKCLFLYGACLLVIMLLNGGCASTLNLQNRGEGRKHLDLAAKLISKGDYAGALKENEKIVRLFPSESPGDSALFYMGLIWAHPNNPQKNYAKALESFQLIDRDYPQSELKEEVSVWSDVIKKLIAYEGDIDDLEKTVTELKNRLNTLKEIDIGIEKKRREGFPLK